MESNELRIFRAVAHEGSITKAAQKLGYVQSNVTARVQQLEMELKTQLFYRQRGMVLTPTGEKLLSYAERILHLLDEANKALNDSIEPNGRLSIGANQTVSTLDLPQILAKYHKAYPNVELSLLTGQTQELVQKILRFELDVVFVKSSVKDDNIVEELVSEENFVLITSPEDRDMKTIYANPFLMSSVGCPNRTQLENWFKVNAIDDFRFLEFNNLDAIISGVIAGLGASFVPQSAIQKYEKDGLLRSFSIPKQYSATNNFLIRHKDVLMTSALSKFIEMVESSTSYHPIGSTHFKSAN
jgi:DNA-binding transcriptional LysR family regulator